MSNRKIARQVFKATHTMHWRWINGRLISPSVRIGGKLYQVEVHPPKRPKIFPVVVVIPGGEFRSISPWGWPRDILRFFEEKRRQRKETIRRLLAVGLIAKRKKEINKL